MSLIGHNAVKRLLGCYMLGVMPDEGINEALSTLKDMFQYYSHPAYPALATPVTAHRITGKVLSVSKRPDLIIAE